MMSVLAQLFAVSEAMLLSSTLVFLRLAPAIALLPGIGESTVPMRLRLVLALTLSVMLAPLVPSGSEINLVKVGLGETLIGICLGLTARLMAQALLIAGTIAGQATSLAQLFGGAVMDGPQPIFSTILYWAGLALLMASGFPVLFVMTFAQTYDPLPIGAPLTAVMTMSWIIDVVATAFSLGFTLSAPFLIGALLYNLAMGVLNRAMPQLMVSFVGAPVITLGSMALLVLAAPLILVIWRDALFETLIFFWGAR